MSDQPVPPAEPERSGPDVGAAVDRAVEGTAQEGEIPEEHEGIERAAGQSPMSEPEAPPTNEP